MKQLAMKEFITDDDIEELGLSRRAYNMLMRAGIRRISQLTAMTAEDLLVIPHLGTKALAEITSKLHSVGLQLNSMPNAVNNLEGSDLLKTEHSTLSLSPLQIHWSQVVGQLSHEINVSLLHPRAVIANRCVGEWVVQKMPEQEAEAIGILSTIEKALALKTVADEVAFLFHSTDEFSAIKVEVFAKRHGVMKQTLEELGAAKGVTRERIRQIERRTEQRLAGQLAKYPLVRTQSALLAAEDMGNDLTYRKWLRSIGGSGLLGHWEKANVLPRKLNIAVDEMMLFICDLESPPAAVYSHRIPENLRFAMSHPYSSARTAAAVQNLPKDTFKTIRRQCRASGAVQVSSLAKSLSFTEQDAALLLRHLGYRRIADDWYTLRLREKDRSNPQWVTLHITLKIIKYCGPLDIKEIHQGVRKHLSRHGIGSVPIPILEMVLDLYGFEIKDGKTHWPFENSAVASSSEFVILKQFDEIGPVVSHFELAQGIMKANLSIPALSVALRYSPLFSRVGMGFYKLRGKTITLGDVENAKSRQVLTEANAEIAFHLDASIELKVTLGSMTITSGVLYSSQLPNLTGKWPAFSAVCQVLCKSSGGQR
jgi:hypothetical protein